MSVAANHKQTQYLFGFFSSCVGRGFFSSSANCTSLLKCTRFGYSDQESTWSFSKYGMRASCTASRVFRGGYIKLVLPYPGKYLVIMNATLFGPKKKVKN